MLTSIINYSVLLDLRGFGGVGIRCEYLSCSHSAICSGERGGLDNELHTRYKMDTISDRKSTRQSIVNSTPSA